MEVSVKVPLSALPQRDLERIRCLADMAAFIARALGRQLKPNITWSSDPPGIITVRHYDASPPGNAFAEIRLGKKLAYLTVYL